MALTPKLEIKQSQSLLLTPQLRQAIGLLQLTNLELNELIEQELLHNPLLEREDDHLNTSTDSPLQTIDDYNSEPNNPYSESPLSNDTDEQAFFDDYGSDTEGYTSFENTDWSDYNHSKNPASDDPDYDYFSQKLSQDKSLYNILDEQISLHFTRQSDRLIAKYLTEFLDDAGYFRGSTNDIATKLGTSPTQIEKILTKLKTFEPSGIFAQTLSECLQIQLHDKGLLSPAMQILLNNLELAANRKFKELAKLCNCTPEDILSLLATIKTQNPKPAADYFAAQTTYIIPDVLLKRNTHGEYMVELNPLSLPKLLINHRYYSELKSDKKAARFLKSNLSHASFLIKSMHQRATTILRVAEEITLRQYAFFEHGIEHLKPMSLKDIAQALSVNESTASRVTSGKYISTPRGLFELKYFFSSAAGSYIGDNATSTTTIKHKIKTLIENESPQDILSDDKIVSLLEQDGFKIARRTVTKYREALGLPTSGERKRAKRV